MNRGMNGGMPNLNGAAVAIAAQAGRQQAQMVLAQPFNDVQLLAFVAAQLQGGAAERVKFAMQLVAEVVAHQHELGALIQEKVEAQKAKKLAV